MTKQCRYFLKCCKCLGESDFSYNAQDSCIRNIHEIKGGIEIKKYNKESDNIFEYLTDNGYLSQTQFGYSLTQKGLHPNRMILEEIRAFLIKSIFVPIIVSALTSIITLYIEKLL